MRLRAASQEKRRGRRPRLPSFLTPPAPRPTVWLAPIAPPDVLCLPHPDWLWQVVTVTGPAGAVAELECAAAGSGTVPWIYDYDRLEEGWFLAMLCPPGGARPSISAAGARILAREVRDGVMEDHDAATALVEVARHIPLDLHVLVPVPLKILKLGPDDPAALAWLWEHWGTTWPLRHVERRPLQAAEVAALAPGQAAWRVGFFSADWTPWRALQAVLRRWPELRVTVRATYAVP